MLAASRRNERLLQVGLLMRSIAPTNTSRRLLR
jgi:hypothetical protein